MNKTIVIVGGVIIVVAIIVGGILYSKQQNANIPIVDNSLTPVAETTGNINTNPVVVKKAGVPIISTNSTVWATETTATINGTINPEGAISSYWFEYGLTSNLGSKTSSQIAGSGFTTIATPGYLSGLTKNSTYYFSLIAENQYGKVTGTSFTFKTIPGNPAPVGSAPIVKTVAASSVSRTTANLNGQVTPNKATTEYWFEYGKTTDLGNTSNISSVTSGSAKTSVSISLASLDPSTLYYFRLNAQNQFGTVNGSVLSFKTLGPTKISAH